MSDSSATTQQPAAAPKSPETPAQQQQRQIQAYLRAPAQRLYANGFATAASAADVSLVLLAHGSPTGIVTMSYSTAKSLINDLTEVLAGYERKTGEKVKDIKALQILLQEKSK